MNSPSDREPIVRMTFIVRMTTNEAGHVAGIVEQVRSGRKERFDGVQVDKSGAMPAISAVTLDLPHRRQAEED